MVQVMRGGDAVRRGSVSTPALLVLGLVAGPENHPTRRRILDYLRAIPGDHFRSIARNLGLSVGETRHHLHMLIREELVFERKEGGRSRYYVRDRLADAERNELFSRQWAYRDLRMRILTRLRTAGPASGKELAGELGISRQLAAYHLARLAELGFIHREGRHFQALPVERESTKARKPNKR